MFNYFHPLSLLQYNYCTESEGSALSVAIIIFDQLLQHGYS